MPYVTEDTLGELDCKMEELRDQLDMIVKDQEKLEQKVYDLEVERSDLRAALEECLEWFQDRYDVGDTDEDGQPMPNAEMRMGQQVEEWLGRGGF